MELPPALAGVFRQDVDKMEVENRMPYITSIERLARHEGQREDIKSLLRVRFGDEGLKRMSEIRAVHEEETLRAILKSLETATTLDDVRRLWSSGNP